MTVRVWNDNKFEHHEKFRGKQISIPAGGYVEMTADDAVLFKSQFTPMMKNKGGGEDDAGFISHNLWGGDAGERWARSIIERVEKRKKK